MRHVDGWDDARKRLREIVEDRGPTEVAAEIPCARTTLFRWLHAETVPSLPSQECVERFLDDHDIRTN